MSQIFMLTKLNIHSGGILWKRAVEKSVENVEKLEFSTDIPAVWNFSTGPDGCIIACITGPRGA